VGRSGQVRGPACRPSSVGREVRRGGFTLEANYAVRHDSRRNPGLPGTHTLYAGAEVEATGQISPISSSIVAGKHRWVPRLTRILISISAGAPSFSAESSA
jgi:hypothetical protein